MRLLGRGTTVAPLQRSQLEAALLNADAGTATTRFLLDQVEARCRKEPQTTAICALQQALEALLTPVAEAFVPVAGFSIILLNGTNGSGKTTTAAKLCHRFSGQGRRVMLAAADTFRAAAIEQLCIWGKRCQVPVIAREPGADPAAVTYDAVTAAQTQQRDLLIIDTAGRQHSSKPMLQELQKIRRVLDKAAPAGTPVESWLILDAATGQNALRQAREFLQHARLTGLVVTRLDSSARGGMILALARELSLPVRFIGTGETLEDLSPLDATAFAKALLDSE